MKIQVLSDLQIEFAPFEMVSTSADLIILAGDVHTGLNGVRWIKNTIESLPVVYVLGNHEFYGQTQEKLISAIHQEAAGTNIHFLDNGVFELCDYRFLGATFWSDFELQGDFLTSQTAAMQGMTDFRRIRTLPNYRRFRPQDARAINFATRQWMVNHFIDRTKKSIVVTHHAPSAKSLPDKFKGDVLSPAYASNCNDLVTKSGAALWVHGHIHHFSDYYLGDTRVVCNPRGYPGEQSKFSPDFIVEI